MNRRVLLQAIGALPFAFGARARVALVAPEVIKNDSCLVPHPPKDNIRSVLYIRGIRKIEASPGEFGDYQRDGDMYVIHARIRKGDWIERDVFGQLYGGKMFPGILRRHDRIQVVTDIEPNRWNQLFPTCIYAQGFVDVGT